ncbi:hypothetical protein PAAG_08344 [Paracoccidioides lutzii Pb01]|uniref:Uncharacterized protein n=1 Tax=Paracoccidioides lutzii (strain ATCC MYA-826 / Pb01) TaxID=502779 RepID=C1HC53_PARBA|nr:hypothetical protein PAAG_08344 [Paracoccidioides lutzii Pb01]EEH38617.2 hypothetical protein PAAG_08344 [Paracoccidioides lutzii Pb01]
MLLVIVIKHTYTDGKDGGKVTEGPPIPRPAGVVEQSAGGGRQRCRGRFPLTTSPWIIEAHSGKRKATGGRWLGWYGTSNTPDLDVYRRLCGGLAGNLVPAEGDAHSSGLAFLAG